MTLAEPPVPIRLSDSYGRVARKLRISVTDRCNLRCLYCMPLHPRWLPEGSLLSFDEIVRLARIGVGLGLSRLRLTGGEPLVRPGLPDLVERLSRLPGLKSLGLTSNGTLMKDLARPLAEAGLHSVNISLDTLDPKEFQKLARSGSLDRVLAGIDETLLHFRDVKLNAVIVRGRNEEQIPALCLYARERKIPVRFIEFMPLDGDQAWGRDQFVPEAEILRRAGEVSPLIPALDTERSSPARRWLFADGRGEVGVIASVTRPFCADCDRLRVSADGRFRTCLFALEGSDLRGPLRSGASDADIAILLGGATSLKQKGHAILSSSYKQPPVAMNVLGG